MRAIIYFLSIIIMLTSGCSQSKKDEGKNSPLESSKEQSGSSENIVARVNSRPIYETELRDRNLDDIIADEILYQDAIRQGLDKDVSIEDRVKRYKRNLIVSTLVKSDEDALRRVASKSRRAVQSYLEKKLKPGEDGSNEEELNSQQSNHAIPKDFLYEEAVRVGLDKDEKIIDDVNKFRRNLVTYEYKNKLVPDLSALDDINQEDINKFYEDNRLKFTKYDLEFLSLNDKGVADELDKRAKAGEDLKNLYSQYNAKYPDAKIIYRKLFYNTKYANLLVGKQVGTVSDILNEDDNYKILKLKNIRVEPVSRVQGRIKNYLLIQKKDRKLREIANSVAKKNNIEVEIYMENQKI